MPHFTSTFADLRHVAPAPAPAFPAPGTATLDTVLAYLADLHQDIAALTEMVISIEQTMVGSAAVAEPDVEADAVLAQPSVELVADVTPSIVEPPVEPPAEPVASAPESDEPELL